MQQLKCDVCNKKMDWFYETTDDSNFYCDEHLPCGRFKKFIGKYIAPIVMEFYLFFK